MGGSYVSKGWPAIPCNPARTRIPVPPLHTPEATDGQCPSTPRAARVGLGAFPSPWSLEASHTVQQDQHCAPRGPPLRVEGVSYSGQGLQAETAMTHQLSLVLHDAQRRARSTSRGLSDFYVEPLTSRTIQISPVLLLIMHLDRAPPRRSRSPDARLSEAHHRCSTVRVRLSFGTAGDIKGPER